MSTAIAAKKMNVAAFRRRRDEKLVVLTAYSASIAKLIAPHVDAILVGDSLGMVLYGLPTTLNVTIEMMERHSEAVRRGAEHAFVVTDLPFGSYHESPDQAFRSAAAILRSGADAVKLEGGVEMADTIRFLTERGIPVMGHVGLMPQRINMLGSFRAQGRDATSAAQIQNDAAAVAAAGAFSVVLEGVIEPLAAEIAGRLDIPTIGIGASPACAGQVLVTDDLIGLFSDFKPKFVRRYADISGDIAQAVQAFADDVRQGKFPDADECFT